MERGVGGCKARPFEIPLKRRNAAAGARKAIIALTSRVVGLKYKEGTSRQLVPSWMSCSVVLVIRATTRARRKR